MRTSLFALALAAWFGGRLTNVAADPIAVGDPRMTLPTGAGTVSAVLAVNLSKDAGFEPVSVAPDLWYGASARLSLGLVHSGRAASGFFGDTADSLCLRSATHGCPRLYDRVGMLARYHLRDGRLTVALEGGLLVRGFEPFTLGAKAGVVARWQRGRLAVDLAPNLWLGLAHRAGADAGRLNLPVAVTCALTSRFALAAQSGLWAPLRDPSGNAVVPLSVGAEVLATNLLVIDLAFSLPALIDGDDATDAADARTLTVGVGHEF